MLIAPVGHRFHNAMDGTIILSARLPASISNGLSRLMAAARRVAPQSLLFLVFIIAVHLPNRGLDLMAKRYVAYGSVQRIER